MEDTTVENQDELVRFFKALSDATRLQMAGRLAETDCTVEALAEWLGEKPAAVRHHLGQLAAAGLVEAVAGASGPVYRLRLAGARALAGRLLAHPATPVPEGAAANAFESKVLREFLTPEGALRDLPVQEKKFQVVLRYVLQSFEAGQRYSEKEVNARLQRFHPDSATLRRALIDRGWLARQSGGQAYWRG
jgi:DNA-binding transcriptional ArsR family regulator